MSGRILRLAATGLSCGYPGRLVLSGIELDLAEGEVLALIGPNGSGKTTLFRTLSGELRPLAGEALVATQSGSALVGAQGLSRAARARVIARVLQAESPSWPSTVREYVEAGTFASTGWFGSPGLAEARAVVEAMKATGIAELEGRRVTELSGGEFRLVLIARALAQKPAVLLLDEPAAELDIARQMEVLGLLRELSGRGVAVALSVHDLNLAAMVADRVALLARGSLIAVGRPREVITAESVAAAYGASVVVGDHPAGDLPHIVHIPDWLDRNPPRGRGRG